MMIIIEHRSPSSSKKNMGYLYFSWYFLKFDFQSFMSVCSGFSMDSVPNNLQQTWELKCPHFKGI